MKKKILFILALSLCFVILAGCGNGNSDSNPDQAGTAQPTVAPPIDVSTLSPEEYYKFDSATNTILGFADGVTGITDIEIPAEIDGTAVLNIGASAFNFKGLNSVVLPDGLISIGDSAFKENNLTEIILPDSLTEISLGAFWKNKLKEITIPDGITTIEIRSFSDNEITKIVIPESVTVIRRGAFQENSLKELNIPSNIKQLESNAFQNNEIDTLILNEGLERIDGYAFIHNKLTSLTIPASVTLIGEPSAGISQPNNYSNFVFADNDLSTVTILGDDTVLTEFLMGETNQLREAYNIGGAGTYTGTQMGPWEKTSGN